MIRPRIFDARIDIEIKCNYRCPFCWAAKNPPKAPTTMPLEVLEGLLPALQKNCWHVYLSCGGEPLLHPDFNRVMEIVNKHLNNTDVTLITNGRLLDKTKAKAIVEAGIIQVDVSVHSTNSDLYSRLSGIKGSDHFEKVRENIDGLIRLRGSRRWPKVIINSVAMKSTIPGLKDLAEWVSKSEIDGLRIKWMLPVEAEFFEDQYVKPQEQHKKLLSDIGKMVVGSGKFYDYPLIGSIEKVISVFKGMSNTQYPLEYLIYATRKFRAAVLSKQCGVFGLSLFADQKGIIYACPDGRRPLGHYSEIDSRKLSGRVARLLKDRSIESCGDCGFLSALQISGRGK